MMSGMCDAWHCCVICVTFHVQAHDEVRFLLYRLDFNDFARRRTADDPMEM